MAKVTAWLVTLIAIFLIIPLVWTLDTSMTMINNWIIAILVLIIGITKLVRNYSKKRK